MKLNTIILDDEKSACEVLNSMITDYCPDLSIQLVTQDPEEALETIATQAPDLLFIDINMPKMSGFEFLEKLTDYKGKIIFTTAYDQYAIKAFKYSAFDYLLKPIHIEQLEQTVKRLIKTLGQNKNQVKELLSYIHKNSTITIPHNGDKVFINTKQILYLEALGNYTSIITEGKKYTASKTLKEFEKMLDDNIFIRVHKSYIVNIKQAEKFNSKTDGDLVLKSGETVPVSRRRRHLLNLYSI